MTNVDMEISDLSDEESYIFTEQFYTNVNCLKKLVPEHPTGFASCHCNPYTSVNFGKYLCIVCHAKSSKSAIPKRSPIEKKKITKSIPQSLLPGGSRFSQIKIDNTFVERLEGNGLSECWPSNVNDVDSYWRFDKDIPALSDNYFFFEYLFKKSFQSKKRKNSSSSSVKVYTETDGSSTQFKEGEEPSRDNQSKTNIFYTKTRSDKADSSERAVRLKKGEHYAQANEQRCSDNDMTRIKKYSSKRKRDSSIRKKRSTSRSGSFSHGYFKETEIMPENNTAKRLKQRESCPNSHKQSEQLSPLSKTSLYSSYDTRSSERLPTLLKSRKCRETECPMIHRFPRQDEILCKYLNSSCVFDVHCNYLHDRGTHSDSWQTENIELNSHNPSSNRNKCDTSKGLKAQTSLVKITHKSKNAKIDSKSKMSISTSGKKTIRNNKQVIIDGSSKIDPRCYQRTKSNDFKSKGRSQNRNKQRHNPTKSTKAKTWNNVELGSVKCKGRRETDCQKHSEKSVDETDPDMEFKDSPTNIVANANKNIKSNDINDQNDVSQDSFTTAEYVIEDNDSSNDLDDEKTVYSGLGSFISSPNAKEKLHPEGIKNDQTVNCVSVDTSHNDRALITSEKNVTCTPNSGKTSNDSMSEKNCSKLPSNGSHSSKKNKSSYNQRSASSSSVNQSSGTKKPFNKSTTSTNSTLPCKNSESQNSVTCNLNYNPYNDPQDKLQTYSDISNSDDESPIYSGLGSLVSALKVKEPRFENISNAQNVHCLSVDTSHNNQELITSENNVTDSRNSSKSLNHNTSEKSHSKLPSNGSHSRQEIKLPHNERFASSVPSDRSLGPKKPFNKLTTSTNSKTLYKSPESHNSVPFNSNTNSRNKLQTYSSDSNENEVKRNETKISTTNKENYASNESNVKTSAGSSRDTASCKVVPKKSKDLLFSCKRSLVSADQSVLKKSLKSLKIPKLFNKTKHIGSDNANINKEITEKNKETDKKEKKTMKIKDDEDNSYSVNEICKRRHSFHGTCSTSDPLPLKNDKGRKSSSGVSTILPEMKKPKLTQSIIEKEGKPKDSQSSNNISSRSIQSNLKSKFGRTERRLVPTNSENSDGSKLPTIKNATTADLFFANLSKNLDSKIEKIESLKPTVSDCSETSNSKNITEQSMEEASVCKRLKTNHKCLHNKLPLSNSSPSEPSTEVDLSCSKELSTLEILRSSESTRQVKSRLPSEPASFRNPDSVTSEGNLTLPESSLFSSTENVAKCSSPSLSVFETSQDAQATTLQTINNQKVSQTFQELSASLVKAHKRKCTVSNSNSCARKCVDDKLKKSDKGSLSKGDKTSPVCGDEKQSKRGMVNSVSEEPIIKEYNDLHSRANIPHEMENPKIISEPPTNTSSLDKHEISSVTSLRKGASISDSDDIHIFYEENTVYSYAKQLLILFKGGEYDGNKISEEFVDMCADYAVEEFENDNSIEALDRNVRRFGVAYFKRKHCLSTKDNNIRFDIPLDRFFNVLEKLRLKHCKTNVN